MVNKLGNTASFGSDPRRVETAGNQQFGTQQEALTATIQARYDSLKMSYQNPKSGGDVAKDSTVDSQEMESLIFFFRPDHLGSTSYVTCADGTVAQHVEYIPYGEVFVEERNSSFSTSYLFNAKELDDETGMYYYGARYLDPVGAMWISVDPMWEKFAGMTAYNYCAGNPVKMVDPDGREVSDPDGIEASYKKYVTDSRNTVQGLMNKGLIDNNVGGKMVSLYDDVLCELTELENSDQVYNVHYDNGDGGGMSYNSATGEVSIGLGDKTIELASHELKHAYQFECGEISLKTDNSGWGKLYDIGDETEAYNRANAIAAGMQFFTSPNAVVGGHKLKMNDDDVRSFGLTMSPPAYQDLSNGPINMQSSDGRALREGTMSLGKTNSTVKDYYKGWKTDYNSFRK